MTKTFIVITTETVETTYEVPAADETEAAEKVLAGAMDAIEISLDVYDLAVEDVTEQKEEEV